MEKKEKKKGWFKQAWSTVKDTFTDGNKEVRPEENLNNPEEKIVNLSRFCVKFYENSLIVIKRNEENAIEFSKNNSGNNFEDAKLISKELIDNKKEKLVAQHGYSALLGVITLEGYKFQIFAKKVEEKGNLWGNKIYEIKGVKFNPISQGVAIYSNMGKITEQINQIKKLFKECGFYYNNNFLG